MVLQLPRRFLRYVRNSPAYAQQFLRYVRQSLDEALDLAKGWLRGELDKSKNNNNLDEKQEREIGITLSGFLVAISAACLAVMLNPGDSDQLNPVLNTVVCALGLLSLLTSALMIDSILDRFNVDFWSRLSSVLNGGYALFSVVMAGISAGIIYFYKIGQGTDSIWTLLLIGLSSVFLFFKLMRDDKEHSLGALLLVSYLAALFARGDILSIFVGLLFAIPLFFVLRRLGSIWVRIKSRTAKHQP